ncbi:hypothetical protein Tco_0944184 [Tanacetum coccineum]
MKAICNLDVLVDSKAPKPSSQTEEVPQGKKLGAESGPKSLSHPSPPTLVVGEMHKEAHQAAGGQTSLGSTNKKGAHAQLSSGTNPSVLMDQTIYAGDGLKTGHANLGTNEESKANDISKKIKLEDLSDLLKDTRSTFFNPDSPQDKLIIVSDKGEEEEEVAKNNDTHASSHDSYKDELEQQKAKAKSEVASLKARPLFLDINQLTNLLVTSLKPELSKILASHNLASCLPTKLKELLLKFIELSREIKELKQHVKDMEIEQLKDLKDIPAKLETFTSTISSLTS